jgi:hypothetical protein
MKYLETVKSFRVHYESFDAPAMTNKIKSILAFKGLASPMKEFQNVWIPDFDSRYFTADFSYGLKIIKDIAELFEQPIQNINRVWAWYKRVSPVDA